MGKFKLGSANFTLISDKKSTFFFLTLLPPPPTVSLGGKVYFRRKLNAALNCIVEQMKLSGSPSCRNDVETLTEKGFVPFRLIWIGTTTFPQFLISITWASNYLSVNWIIVSGWDDCQVTEMWSRTAELHCEHTISCLPVVHLNSSNYRSLFSHCSLFKWQIVSER